MNDADSDRITVAMQQVLEATNHMASEAFSVRNQHRHQIDRMREDYADLESLCLRQQDEIKRLNLEIETMRRLHHASVEARGPMLLP